MSDWEKIGARRFTDEERAALLHLTNDEADFFEVNGGDYAETAKHRAIIWAMLDESSESSSKANPRIKWAKLVEYLIMVSVVAANLFRSCSKP